MTESVGFGDAPVPADRRPRDHPDRDPDRPLPRVVVRYTLHGDPSTTAPDRPVLADQGRWATLTAWLVLAVSAALSGVVAVMMLTAWSEMLVDAASSTNFVLVGGGHGLLLLAGAFLVLVAAMVKVWALGAVVGTHHEAPLLLGTMLALDLAVATVGALGGGGGILGCSGVVLLDLLVIAVLVLARRRRHRTTP